MAFYHKSVCRRANPLLQTNSTRGAFSFTKSRPSFIKTPFRLPSQAPLHDCVLFPPLTTLFRTRAFFCYQRNRAYDVPIKRMAGGGQVRSRLYTAEARQRRRSSTWGSGSKSKRCWCATTLFSSSKIIRKTKSVNVQFL